MRYRIDYRWILTTSVVVGVAAAGTAAIVRQGNAYGDLQRADEMAGVALTRVSTHVPVQIDPARLSHDSGSSSANLPAFEPEALPPTFTPNPDRSRQAAQFSQNFGPSGSSRTAEYVAARLSGGGGGERWMGGIGSGGFAGSIGGGPGRSAGGGVTNPGSSASTPSSRPADTAPSSGSPQPPASSRPAPPTVPGAPPSPILAPGAGSPSTGPAAVAGGPSGPATPGDGPSIPGIMTPPSGPGKPSPAVDGPPFGDPPPGAPAPLSPTPEPASLMLFGTGLVGMYGILRRRLR